MEKSCERELILDNLELASHRAIRSALKNGWWFKAKDWYYDEFKALCVGCPGYDATILSAVAAVLSPGVRWGSIRNNMPSIMEQGGHLSLAYKANQRKARALIENWKSGKYHKSDILEDMTGRKVRSFYRNLCGETNVVTVDSHMVSLAYKCGPSERPNLNDKRYSMIEDCIVELVDIIDPGLTPSELQAILWVYQRGGELW